MTWDGFLNALVEIHAVQTVGLSLLILGALFRWYDQLSRWLGMRRETLAEAWWIKPRPGESGLRGEARVQDHLRRLAAYGKLMMIAGIVLLLLGAGLD